MNRTSPCVLIGWDGATFDLLLPWVEQGLLPNLGRILKEGCARPLRSVIPPISPAAWASILTGMNPGKHGILDFKEFNASDYVPLQPTLINSTHFAGTTIFDVLSDYGLRVCALQLPMTYPVWPINGLMLAGIPNPDDSRCYTYPSGRDFGPLRPSRMRQQQSYAELLGNCRYHVRKLTDIFIEVAPEEYDFTAIYYRECDDFHHLYWRLLDEQCEGFDAADRDAMGNPILTIYQLLDVELGRLLQARPDANFFLISDHGGTAIGRRRLNLNTWLQQRGYLHLRRSVLGTLQRGAYRAYQACKPWIGSQLRKTLQNDMPRVARAFARLQASTDAVDWEATQAFAVHLNFPTAGIQLNVRQRERNGAIDAGSEYEQVRDQIITELKTLTDPATGKTVVRDVFRREELFHGPHLDRAPDILAHFDTSVLVRTELSPRLWTETAAHELHDLSGDHDLNGIFAAIGPDVLSSGMLPSQATIMDVAPTMLRALAQPVPENMDGRALEEVFLPSFVVAHPPRTSDGRGPVLSGGQNVYSPDEEEAIRSRLEALGYLGE